jgi:hypothetical protein
MTCTTPTHYICSKRLLKLMRNPEVKGCCCVDHVCQNISKAEMTILNKTPNEILDHQ